MDNNPSLQNYVFISYNHKDVEWAKWLQKRLERYRLPAEAHNELSDSRYIRPVFRDRDNLTSGVLNDELRKHLESSKYLVILCSPNSAPSDWVSDEIKAFINMGRLDKIVPFIIDGSPQEYSNADITRPLMGECYPLALRQWNAEHPDKNLLGIAVDDYGEKNRNKAFIRLVAHLLGIEFDTLWQRHKRHVRRVVASLAGLAIVAFALAYWFMIPVKVTITIKDEPNHLPGMEFATLYANGSEYSFTKPDTTISISALPGYYRLKSIPIKIQANRFYNEVNVPVHIGAGIRQQVTLQMRRDSTFATFAGTVYDGGFDDFHSHPVENATVTVGSHKTLTDGEGHFTINIPLEEQAEFLPLSIEKQGYQIYQRADESPFKNLTYLLHQ